ncbi:MAG TPA: maltose alpha-D-glucosyltransferase [Bryobacteraceae bacterium]
MPAGSETATETLAIKKLAGATDPLWYKDAIIYEVHVRGFFDSNNDGIGDLPGLTQKLDYLKDLGITCLWLLPFFPSPLKDDGYDISDYTNVHPMYGTMDDFKAFISAAHERDFQVVIELVINHTSDQHAWFQAARQAPPGSPERDFYVWSDTDERFAGARIIFSDTEKSNWTWDPVAQAYYWHRFFSHQPDLNYDNPRVMEEVVKVARFWLDLGVDGLRTDAIPYLVEREGTNCENLPETHAIIKRLRREIDAAYANRMILAEANQWPTDVRPYFGDGDECHMAFHFPLMPRIYMALRQEDLLPITDIMAQTPPIPDSCQWGLFLRNHDELTLEMVTSDERDYMYLAYSADPRARLNFGIRRRLAPLMDNNRRRIELLNSLLFSFPGTPIIYYGDEIGMGDNIYLGDRNGVRTPMQWNSDRNAGFSRATPAKLYSPVVLDAVWGYEAVNVEAQQADPSSLLSWMRNMIALRKLFHVFGRGSLEFLHPPNRKVLAYLRSYGEERVLCVANLSRFAQPVDLDLSKLDGTTPIEMLGYVEFPAIGKQPYRLTLAPYGFLWLELHSNAEASPAEPEDVDQPIRAGQGWESLLQGPAAPRLESALLPAYLAKQRWFGAKSRQIQKADIIDWVEAAAAGLALVGVEVRYTLGEPETYLIPMAIAFGDAATELRQASPNSVIASVISRQGSGVLYDAVFQDDACSEILAMIEKATEIHGSRGLLRGLPAPSFEAIRGEPAEPLTPRRVSAEQSNTSIVFGSRFILKLYRHLQPGLNPDCEIGNYLTNTVHFNGIAPFAGSIGYVPESGDSTVLAMLQGFVENEGDGWALTLEELQRYYENCAALPLSALPEPKSTDPLELSEQETMAEARDHVGIYLESAAALGRRTALLHLALATPSDNSAFSPEPLSGADVQALVEDLRQKSSDVFAVLKSYLPRLEDELVDAAALVLSRRRQILETFRGLVREDLGGQRIRIHGDYHLGQVVRVKTDYVVLDFEGEPARPLAERRSKQSPLKDVAGMLRSFSYAAYAALMNYTARRPEYFDKLEPWARLWDRSVSAEFLRAYRTTVRDAPFLPPDRQDFRKLLDAFLLDKALYELLYELNNRPAWAGIPLKGIAGLLR